jgi:hypothetical protein
VAAARRRVDRLETERRQATRAGTRRHTLRDGDELGACAVDAKLEITSDARRVPARTDAPAFLVRRDLGEIEHEPHVHPIARELDARVVVHREVPERVRVGAARSHQRRGHDGDEDGRERHCTLHESAFRATGAHLAEKAGLWSSAFRYQSRISERPPAQPAAYPRWK